MQTTKHDCPHVRYQDDSQLCSLPGGRAWQFLAQASTGPYFIELGKRDSYNDHVQDVFVGQEPMLLVREVTFVKVRELERYPVLDTRLTPVCVSELSNIGTKARHV